MKNNKTESVKNAIAETQDGKVLNPTSNFSDFILSRIYANSKDDYVDIEGLLDDFKYMAQELYNASTPLLEWYSHNFETIKNEKDEK